MSALEPLDVAPGRLIDRDATMRELVRVVQEDFPCDHVRPDGVRSGHNVEAVTSMVIEKAIRRVAALPAVSDKPVDRVTMRHAVEALRCMAGKRCVRNNCGTVCLCEPCHARAALAVLDPGWTP